MPYQTACLVLPTLHHPAAQPSGHHGINIAVREPPLPVPPTTEEALGHVVGAVDGTQHNSGTGRGHGAIRFAARYHV
jgi:hypothetical protein